MSHDTEEWCKAWRKTLGSKNDMRNLVNFNAGSGMSEICTLMCYFCRKYVSAKKSTEELCVITLKNDPKFEEELTCALKNDVRNLGNFDVTLKICTLMEFFWPKYIMFELKKYRGVMNHYTEDRCKLWKKNDLWFYKRHEELVNFTGALKNLKICILRDFFVQVI